MKVHLLGLLAAPLLLTGVAALPASATVHPAALATEAPAQTRFPASGEVGISPGDPTLAVGKTYIVETTNTQFAVWSKTGTAVQSQDFSTFFPGSSFCVDPRVIYWSWDDRYAVICSEIGTNPRVLRYAVSVTGDPTGAWIKYSLDPVTEPAFYDQPQIMATSDKIVISAFENGDNIIVLDKADVLAGAANPRQWHINLGSAPSSFRLFSPALESTKSATAWLVAGDNFNHIRLMRLTGTPATTVSKKIYDLGLNVWAPPVSTVPLPGGTMDNPPDGRISEAMYEVTTSGKAIIEFGTTAACNGQDCNAIGQITLGRTPHLAYQITRGEPGFDYTFGSVGLDAAGNWFVAYSRSSATQAPQAALMSSAFNQIIYGAAPGSNVGSSGQERWGDYLRVVRDPTQPTHVWCVSLYQAADGVWGSAIAQATASGTL
jgi:hypothetical protein